MKTLVLAAVLTLVAISAVAPGAEAVSTCKALQPGPALDDTWFFTCGRADCVVNGLPNIMVTCL